MDSYIKTLDFPNIANYILHAYDQMSFRKILWLNFITVVLKMCYTQNGYVNIRIIQMCL